MAQPVQRDNTMPLHYALDPEGLFRVDKGQVGAGRMVLFKAASIRNEY